MTYVRAPLRTSWRAVLTASSLPTRSPRHPVRIDARLFSLSTTKSSASRDTGRSRLLPALLLSTSLAIGFLAYQQRHGRSRWDVGIPSLMDTATARSAGRFTPSTGHNLPSPAPTVQPNLLIYDALEEEGHSLAESDLPEELAILTQAPQVPPRIKRNHAALVKVDLTTMTMERQLTSCYKYEQWTFNKMCPGPFIRARAGDVLELSLTNKDETGNPHNIDSHAFIGPGGGAALTTASENETKTGRFKLLYPGLYVYHCAAAPVPVHIANGMYGLIYVQPVEGDLPEVDREYYVMQSEFYHEPPEVDENGKRSPLVEFSYPNALCEEPDVVCFNGSESALTRDRPLKANLGETVRIFFGNAGPNLTSAFHVIGSNFKSVYRDGDVVNAPANFVSTVTVPPGAATIADMRMVVPGTYTLVDHALFRLDKGAAGFLNVSGKARPDIYQSLEHPEPCVGCKLHS